MSCLEMWVKSGQRLEDFWDYAWSEIAIILRGASKRDAHLVWMQANLNALAYHDPKNLPDDPSRPKSKTAQMIEADRIAVHASLVAMANRSKGNG